MNDIFNCQNAILGDCFDIMKTFADNSIDCVLTDPPYGLSFMSKEWDKTLPVIEVWKELFRICKPGAFFLCFGGTRTYHRLACMIEDAGWEIRDCIQWIYGSGFPKSCNFGRKLSNEWHGYGTALKPAYEPILVCMKPIEKTFINNAQQYNVAGLNIDVCRIEALDQEKLIKNWNRKTIQDMSKGNYGDSTKLRIKVKPNFNKGRWPANVIFDEESSKILDEQTENLKSEHRNRENHKVNKDDDGLIYGKFVQRRNFTDFNDSGGASRFFYCAKASSSEKDKGCDGLLEKESGIKNQSGRGFSENNPYKKNMLKNNHPTVKPLKLIKYLLKLIFPPCKDSICLDPFLGSGTTLIAAKELGVKAIGIEKNEEYYKIAKERIENSEFISEQLYLF